MASLFQRLAAQQQQQRRKPVDPRPVSESAATIAARNLLADQDVRGDLEAGITVDGFHPDVVAEALRLIEAEQAAGDA